MNVNHMNLTIFKIAKEFDKSVLYVKYMVTCRNILYKAVSIKNKSFVIRLTVQQIRTKEQLESELHFQDYLFRNGANVTRPLKTVKNEWVSECIVDDKKYYVSAFTFAKGLNWYERDDKNPETFYQIGKALGKVHKLSKNYEVTSYKRRKWYEQQELANAPELFKDYSTELYNSFMSFVDEMKAMKNSQDNGTNFEITECDLQTGRLTIQLSGTALYSTSQVEPTNLKEIVIEQGSDGITLSDNGNKQFFTFRFIETNQNHDELGSR